MKRLSLIVFMLTVVLVPVSVRAQISKSIYISLPGPGNVQHLAYVVAKEKKFYDEMGLTNVNIVVLRGNAMNVQALLSGSVHYSSAFGPSMQAMFRGEQIRVLLQIFNQIPFGLITRPEIKRLEDLKGTKSPSLSAARPTVSCKRYSSSMDLAINLPSISTFPTTKERRSR